MVACSSLKTSIALPPISLGARFVSKYLSPKSRVSISREAMMDWGAKAVVRQIIRLTLPSVSVINTSSFSISFPPFHLYFFSLSHHGQYIFGAFESDPAVLHKLLLDMWTTRKKELLSRGGDDKEKGKDLVTFSFFFFFPVLIFSFHF